MITQPEIAQELARELAARRATYPAMVERMRMTSAAAEREISMAQAWQEDCARYAPWFTGGAPISPQRLTRNFTWADRRRAIADELARRARLYPRWIAGGDLDQAEADQRNQRLAAMAHLYDIGFDYHDSFGTRPPFGPRMTAQDHTEAEAEAEAIRQWHAHVHQVLYTSTDQTQQKELAL